jgi:DNA invertase Pin-like site-specific DNA recombinase
VPLRAVIYARQSLDRQDDRSGVDRQVEDAQALCKARGWTVVETIVDNDVSASRSRENAGYGRLLRMMRDQEMDRVAVQHTDRLYRSMIDLEHLVILSEKSGVRIAAVFGELDLSTDTGRLLARILAAVARAEVERKGARQRRANQQRRQAGVMLWTRRPFGYDRVGDDVFVLEPEARLIRRAADAILAGASVASQVRELNEQGVATTAGNPWRINVLRRALVNPRVTSRVTYLGEETGVAGIWPSILDADVHARLVDLLSDPARRKAPSTVLKYWLSGALECGRCGGRMYSGRTGQWLVYRCRTPHLTRSLPLLDQVMTALLLRRLAEPDFAEALAGDERSAEARENVVRLRERRDALTAMLGEGLVMPAVARPQLERIAAELAAAQAAVATLTGESPALLVRGAADPAATFADLTVAQRRRLFNDLVERCVVLPVGKGATEQQRARALQITWR